MISKILSFQTNNIVSIVQFLTDQVNTIDYISGNKAIENEFVKVKEVNESGSVNNLIVFNNSEHFIFFSDGDILSGAKQNRVLNTSVFLAPNSKTILPVSCIELGRWKSISPEFMGNDYLAPSKLRAKKADQIKDNLKKKRGYLASQEKVWNEVNNYLRCFEPDSATSNLSDVFEQKGTDINDYIKEFKVNQDANGLAVFINKNLLSVDVFNRTNIFREYFNKILRGVATEAIYLKPKFLNLSEAELKYNILTYFDELEKTKFNIYPGVGIGTENRYDSAQFAGFNLTYNEHSIHLSVTDIKN